MTIDIIWPYSAIVREHFLRPRNVVFDEGEAKDLDKSADGIGIIGNALCGDMMKMWIKVRNGKIAECKWQTYGCASAIASTSVLSELVLGKSLAEAERIGPKDIAKSLGGLPNVKLHCSVLGHRALREAIKNYYKRLNLRVPKEEIVDGVLTITVEDIRAAVAAGAKSLAEVQQLTKVGFGDPNCIPRVEALIEKFKEEFFGEGGKRFKQKWLASKHFSKRTFLRKRSGIPSA